MRTLLALTVFSIASIFCLQSCNNRGAAKLTKADSTAIYNKLKATDTVPVGLEAIKNSFAKPDDKPITEAEARKLHLDYLETPLNIYRDRNKLRGFYLNKDDKTMIGEFIRKNYIFVKKSGEYEVWRKK